MILEDIIGSVYPPAEIDRSTARVEPVHPADRRRLEYVGDSPYPVLMHNVDRAGEFTIRIVDPEIMSYVGMVFGRAYRDRLGRLFHQFSDVHMSDGWGGSGIMNKIYASLAIEGMNILSHDRHSPGSVKNYARLTGIEGIEVWIACATYGQGGSKFADTITVEIESRYSPEEDMDRVYADGSPFLLLVTHEGFR